MMLRGCEEISGTDGRVIITPTGSPELAVTMDQTALDWGNTHLLATKTGEFFHQKELITQMNQAVK